LLDGLKQKEKKNNPKYLVGLLLYKRKFKKHKIINFSSTQISKITIPSYIFISFELQILKSVKSKSVNKIPNAILFPKSR
jgi:hypothetical protein